jgi:hypothetical protein
MSRELVVLIARGEDLLFDLSSFFCLGLRNLFPSGVLAADCARSSYEAAIRCDIILRTVASSSFFGPSRAIIGNLKAYGVRPCSHQGDRVGGPLLRYLDDLGNCGRVM